MTAESVVLDNSLLAHSGVTSNKGRQQVSETRLAGTQSGLSPDPKAFLEVAIKEVTGYRPVISQPACYGVKISRSSLLFIKPRH